MSKTLKNNESLIPNIPAFKMQILPIDGRLEQTPFAKDGSAEINSIKVGDQVQGQPVNSKDVVKGRVLQINQQNGQIVSYKVLSTDSEELLLDPTSTAKYNGHGEDTDAVGGIDVNASHNESFQVMNYALWLAENKKLFDLSKK